MRPQMLAASVILAVCLTTGCRRTVTTPVPTLAVDRRKERAFVAQSVPPATPAAPPPPPAPSPGFNHSAVQCADLPTLADPALRCWVARRHCEPEGLINYLALYHCHSRPVVWLVFPVATVLLMYMLGDIAEAHFCPSLAYLSDYLRLAPAVAGPTLLAFGNGSPDISTSLIGLVVNREAKDLGLNAPLGGGLFVISVVVASVTLAAPVEVDPWPFLRDTLFYLAAIVALACAISDGVVHIVEALLLLGLYAAYVLVVIFWEPPAAWTWLRPTVDPVPLPECPAELLGIAAPTVSVETKSPGLEDALALPSHLGPSRRSSFCSSVSHDSHPSPGSDLRFPSSLQSDHPLLYDALHAEGLPDFVSAALYRYYKFRYRRAAKHLLLHGRTRPPEADHPAASSLPHVDRVIVDWYDALLQLLEEDFQWWEQRGWQRVVSTILLPFRLALLLTIPGTSHGPSSWRKPLAVMFPVASLLLLVVAVGPLPFELTAIVLVTGVVLSLAVYHSTHTHKPPSWSVVFAAGGFGMCVVWMFLVAREVVGLLSTLGAVLHVSQPILAVTVLAWGNCIGDLVTDTAMARQGYATTAVCAVYSSPLLTLLVGLGSAFACQALLHFPAFPLGQVREDVAFCFLSLVVVLLASLVCVPLARFRPPRLFGALLLGLYAAFFAAMVGYEKGRLRFDWLPLKGAYCAAPAAARCGRRP